MLHDALAVALTEQGKDTMDKIGRVLFRMREEEGYLLNVRQQRAEDNAIASEITSVVLIGEGGHGAALHCPHPAAARKTATASSPSAPGPAW